MSSSHNIDDPIPECVREIFNYPKAEDWFTVYYITRDRKIIANQQFLFKGRDRVYRQECMSEADGFFAEVCVVFKGRSVRHKPHKDYSLKEVTMGKPFYMSIKGELIP